jgi:hypothetical protein
MLQRKMQIHGLLLASLWMSRIRCNPPALSRRSSSSAQAFMGGNACCLPHYGGTGRHSSPGGQYGQLSKTSAITVLNSGSGHVRTTRKKVNAQARSGLKDCAIADEIAANAVHRSRVQNPASTMHHRAPYKDAAALNGAA